MEKLIDRLAEDVKLRGYSEGTLQRYLYNVKQYLSFTGNIPIQQTNEEHIRAYSCYLREERKLKESTIDAYLAAIIFFYEVTLNRPLNIKLVPYMKKPKSIPPILSRKELSQLMRGAPGIKCLTFLSLGYGSGLRASEVANLCIQDIDSKNMRVFVRCSKGKKDRYTMLSEATLRLLREYWRTYQPKSKEGYIFPSYKDEGPIDSRLVSHAFVSAINNAGIAHKEQYRFHTLRHCFATHLLEAGLSLLDLKEYMGHARLSSTLVYVHLAVQTNKAKSPMDSLMGEDIPW